MAKKDLPPVDMDAVSAHLDRGWDLLKKNDLAGAERSCREAISADPEAPEAYALLGAIRAALGEADKALSQYEKAIELDPDFVAPRLYAAEFLLESDEGAGEALRWIDEALERADEEEDYLDALLLRAEALVTLGREDEAREALGELPPLELPEPVFHLRAARTLLDLGELDEAERHFRQALAGSREPGDEADARHGLGMVHEERGDARAMVQEFLEVRRLDLAEPPPPWAVSQEQFEKIAEEALAELPERVRELLANVPIVASDYPSLDVVSEGYDPRMLGFFSGIPYPEKSTAMGSPPHLDCVYLYRRNIERASRDAEEVAEEIRVTLLHETGHFFGLSEEELEAMGLG